MDGNPELLAHTVGRTPFRNKKRRPKTEGKRRVQNVLGRLKCVLCLEPFVRNRPVS